MWLESHASLARHPKTRRLMQRLGWSLPATIGNLHLLWYWALEYAPTGDLTKFEPEELTYDLDLGNATPEQFIQALIDCGFLDEIGSGSAESPAVAGRDSVLKLHDWPEYTAKSLRPKFRRKPERWHQVLRSYGLPVITRRTPCRRDVGAAAAQEQSDTSHASHNDQKVEYEPLGAARIDCADGRSSRQGGSERNQHVLPAVPDIVQIDSSSAKDGNERHVASTRNSSNEPVTSNGNAAPTHSFAKGDASLARVEIPTALATQPHFGAWWSKLLELYKNKQCPMTAYEQGEVLAMLAKQPFSAVSMLKHSVKNFETSFAALPALGGIRPANTS